ncbi:hypothetical protein AH06_213 [Erwinia phage AH06]|nr:hypothetical protein AH06_213 [Erwinia phage AH06]
MTVIVKITSGENKADENVSKGFELVPIAAGMRAAFVRDDQGKGWLNVHGSDDHGEERLLMALPVLGNAYIMDAGKTVASFSSANIKDRPGYVEATSDDAQPSVVNIGTHVSGILSPPIQGDIIELTSELQDGVDVQRIDGTSDLISLILNGEHTPTEDELLFVKGLAAAIEAYRNFSSKYRPPINLQFTGSVQYPRDKLNNLQELFRVTGTPISLSIETNENDFVTGYFIEGYYNRYDVSNADMLLLRQLRNQQTGLVKNVIDKIIKYYKAGVAIVPLEPLPMMTATQREQIRHSLTDVLRTNFTFILADKTEITPATADEDSEYYTHVVIRFAP